MSLEVERSSPAVADLKNAADWRMAELVAKAVRRYADDGVGFVLHVPVIDGLTSTGC